MKTALNLLVAYLTCDDPVMVTKWANIMASFWHKETGLMVTNTELTTDTITVSLVDGDDAVTTLVIPIYNEPETFTLEKIDGLVAALEGKVTQVDGQGLSDLNFTQELFDKYNALTNYTHPEFHQMSEIDGLLDIIIQLQADNATLSDTIVNATSNIGLKWNQYRLQKKDGNTLTYPQNGDEIQGRGDGSLEGGDIVWLEAINDMPNIDLVVAADYKFLTSYK